MSSLLQLDPRSLAICRILSGLTVVADLLWRAGALRLHYTEQGIWPVSALLASTPHVFPGVYLLAHTTGQVALLFGLHALAGLALALGYRTQMATVLCWYLTRSLQMRQPLLLNGGDYLFAMLLFWAMFVPWGSCWSLDQGQQNHKQAALSTSQRLGTALLALQLPVLYWIAFAHKLEPAWLEGKAVYFALRSSFFARPTAALLLDHPQLMETLNYAVMGWEAVGPLLLLSPWARARIAAALIFAGMHLGLGCFLRIGIFVWTPCLFLVALMPGSIWPRPGGLEGCFKALARRLGLSPGPIHRLPPEVTPFLVFLAVLGIVQSPGYKEPSLVPPSLKWVETATGLRQDWAMFTNLDQLSDGWLVLDGELEDGRRVEILGRDGLLELHPQDRWAGYLWKVASNTAALNEPLIKAMVAQRVGSGLRSVRLVYLRKVWLPDYQDEAPEVVVLWEGKP